MAEVILFCHLSLSTAPTVTKCGFFPLYLGAPLWDKAASEKLRGKRVAWSALGSVVGLTREPEKSVGVAALDAQTGTMVSDAQTNERGLFRLRGLDVGKHYRVVLNDDRLERSAPKDGIEIVMDKTDFQGIELVAVRQTQVCQNGG